ncbi:pyocin knob domain-containing protein, partial [Chromobacterium violaceum]|uniref:pyocin knob domain-containing protein n=2 Tax=Chromobacterium violaceum TaxID=536 RepID=UPI001A95C679
LVMPLSYQAAAGEDLCNNATQGQPVDKVDWNTLLEPGVYSIVDTTFSGLNAPPASYFWGTLQVMRGSPRGSVGGVTQIYTTHGGMAVWLRTAWNDQAWQPWQQLWHSGNQVFSSLIEGNGYQKLPSGLIIQWGQGSLTATLGLPSGFTTALFATGEITFRTSFPTVCCSIMVNGNENSVSGQVQEGYFWVGGRSKEKATIGYTQAFGSSGAGERTAFDWIAIGY